MAEKQDVGFEIRVLSNLLKRKVFAVAAPPDAEEFSEMQGQLIGFLHRNQDRDIFQKDVEENFYIRRSTASRLLTTMEERGLIIRQSVAQDARLKKITPTPAATAIHKDLEARIEAVEAAVSHGLTEEELTQFLATVQKIKRNLS